MQYLLADQCRMSPSCLRCLAFSVESSSSAYLAVGAEAAQSILSIAGFACSSNTCNEAMTVLSLLLSIGSIISFGLPIIVCSERVGSGKPVIGFLAYPLSLQRAACMALIETRQPSSGDSASLLPPTESLLHCCPPLCLVNFHFRKKSQS